MELQSLIARAPKPVSSHFLTRHFDSGETILYPNEPADCLYILTAGTAEVYMQSVSGSALTICLNEAYSLFGELEIFGVQTNASSVIAKTPCSVITLGKSVLLEWMQLDFDMTIHIIRQLGEKLKTSSTALARLSLLSIKDRIISSVYSHDKIGSLSHLNKHTLAAEVCAPVRSVNRSLALCNHLFIYQDKRFIITDKAALQACAQQLLL